MTELKPCPKCGRRPLIGYACGEWFIVGQVEGCGVCGATSRVCVTIENAIEARNRRISNE